MMSRMSTGEVGVHGGYGWKYPSGSGRPMVGVTSLYPGGSNSSGPTIRTSLESSGYFTGSGGGVMVCRRWREWGATYPGRSARSWAGLG